MGFNPADFRTELGQSEATAKQVRRYLQVEEEHFLDNILHAFQIPIDESDAVKSGGEEEISSRFGKAIDRVIARIEASLRGERELLKPAELDIVVAHVRAALRHYEEILEACAAQIFSELEKMRVDQVGDDTIQAVEIVKDKLGLQISDCMQQVWRLESKLMRYRTKVTGGWAIFDWVRSYYKPVIDRGITPKLRRLRKTVNQNFHQLKIRHLEYKNLSEWSARKQAKLDHYPIFQALSSEQRVKFAELYRLMKMLKRSESTSEFVQEELNRLLTETIQVEDAVGIFRSYKKALTKALYVLRRGIPQELDSAEDLKQAKAEVLESITSHRKEVRILGSMVFRYRDFVLNTHPDPYVRARLGFAESTVGPEPETTKRLVRLGHEVEELDKLYYGLVNATESYDPSAPPELELGYFDEIVENLDEILLAAKRPQEALERYQQLFEELSEVDELTSFDSIRVMGFEKALRLALRLDHFDVLMREKTFMTLYERHIHIREQVSNPKRRELLDGMAAAAGDVSTWVELANTLLDDVQEYVDKKKGETPLPIEIVMGDVRVRRHVMLELLFSYRKLVSGIREKGQRIGRDLEMVLERINSIEADFLYLTTRVERDRGPMTLEELRCLENQ